MASIGELIVAFSALTRLPEPSVAQVARTLRDASPALIKSGGRGRSAAKMGAEDCAALMIGCLASPTANRAPQYVGAYNEIFDLHYEGARRVLKGIEAFADESKNAFNFLASLIESASDGRLATALDRIAEKNYGNKLPTIEISFFKPVPELRAVVRKMQLGDTVWHASFKQGQPFKRIDGSLVVQRGGTFGARGFAPEQSLAEVDHLIFKDDQDKSIFGRYIDQGEGEGLKEEVTITHRIIFGLGALIR